MPPAELVMVSTRSVLGKFFLIYFLFVFHLSPTLGPVGPMSSFTCFPFIFYLFVFHLFPTLGPVGRMISFTCLPFLFHLFSTCFRLWVRLFA